MSDLAQNTDLDATYGVLRNPTEIRAWEIGSTPASLTELTHEVGQNLRVLRDVANNDLLKHTVQCPNFIWAIDSMGIIRIACEELAHSEAEFGILRKGLPRFRGFTDHPAISKKLGHPTLVGGASARIAGELFLDEQLDGSIEWTANCRSGRYCADTKPDDSHCISVHNQLKSLVDDRVLWDNWIQK